jgi:tetratricopeptide (TPR) repeat protein
MRVFLSHSSADKKSYADIIAEKFGGRIEYDTKTFEEGMATLEEIMTALGKVDIFVLLISDNSLNSQWVQKEIVSAKYKIDSNELIKFFPILIDRSISYDDARIPPWISETYNLRPVTRPVVAAKRIRERLIEASWNIHPSLKDRHEIFVGRNSLVASFEERMDDYSLDAPTAIFTSGLQGIGRKSLMTHALKKSNTVRRTYDPLRITLSRDDSIEGFIVKLFDTGLFDGGMPEGLMAISMNKKVEIASEYISQLEGVKEILLIEDQRCIVRYDQTIAPWFLDVLEKSPKDRILMCIASSAKAHTYKFKNDARLFFQHVSELEKVERNGLFKRYLELLNVEISREELKEFAHFLTGLPGQVTFAASMVEELGPQGALQRSNEIVAFAKTRAGVYLRKYDGRPDALEALRFLSSFEFFSLDFVLEISSISGSSIDNFLNEFISDFVCEPVGSTGSYYRVNEIVRDSIVRDNLYMSANLNKALKKYVKKFTDSYIDEGYDVSEYYIAAREALSSNSGEKLLDRLLIPAHFLRTMKDLYTSGKYDEVIKLADRVLQSEENYDQHTSQDVRYYLCQSLAKNRDARFTTEVQKIKGPEHEFLFGFYYRLRGRYEASLVRYRAAKGYDRTEQRASREIVFVLTTIEDYDGAFSLAKENFERYPQNPFMVQAYLQCVMQSNRDDDSKNTSRYLLNCLRDINSRRSEEMYATQGARFEFQFGNSDHAFEMIDAAILSYPDVEYPVLTKLDMAIHIGDETLISDALSLLKTKTRQKSHLIAKKKAEIILQALGGDKARAIRMIDQDLSEMSTGARDRLKRRVVAL